MARKRTKETDEEIILDVTPDGHAKITFDDGFAIHEWRSPEPADEDSIRDLEAGVPASLGELDVDAVIAEAKSLASLVLEPVTDLEPQLLRATINWHGGDRLDIGPAARNNAFFVEAILRAEDRLRRALESRNPAAIAHIGKRLGALCAEWKLSRCNKKAAKWAHGIMKSRANPHGGVIEEQDRRDKDKEEHYQVIRNTAKEILAEQPGLRGAGLYNAIRRRRRVTKNTDGYSDATIKRALRELFGSRDKA